MAASRIECYRLSGGGNDFLALAEPATQPRREQIRSWCTRGLSLGADGLFVIARSSTGIQMSYFNADGHAADLCVNGTRCAARLARHLGWTDGPVAIETGAGTLVATTDDEERVCLELPPPTAAPQPREVEVGGKPWAGWFQVVGVPQFVLAWPQPLADAPVLELGRRLRHHQAFGAAGTNVMFARFLPPHRLEVRSYERGVEAETLACGTGVLAAAAVAVAEEQLALPIRALTGGGFELEVHGVLDDDGRIASWRLTGDARLLARLELEPGADLLPPPPSWS
jgi:diaminopimelate epimerase